MNLPTCAQDFIRDFVARFENDGIHGWSWDADASDFGKTLSWDVRPVEPEEGVTVQVNAAIDLQETQLMLSISERDLAVEAGDTLVTYEALLQFEDRTLSVNGESRAFSSEEIAALIDDFNERTRA